jgi:hypothetical protein
MTSGFLQFESTIPTDTLFIFLMVKFSQNNDLTDVGSRCSEDCSRVQTKSAF